MDVTLPALQQVVAMPPAALYGNQRAYLVVEPAVQAGEPTDEGRVADSEAVSNENANANVGSTSKAETANDDYQVMQSIRVEIIGEQRQPDGQLWLLARSEKFVAGAELIVTQIPGAADGVAVKKVSTEQADAPSADGPPGGPAATERAR